MFGYFRNIFALITDEYQTHVADGLNDTGHASLIELDILLTSHGGQKQRDFAFFTLKNHVNSIGMTKSTMVEVVHVIREGPLR